MIKVGLIGIGGMGRMHFSCYKENPDAQIYAICDCDERKLIGDWSGINLNLDATKSEMVDLSGIKTYSSIEDIIADPEIDLIDICLPTPLHASTTIAALRAGKNVLCEKPMAMNEDECSQMEAVVAETGKQLMIGHCLRYWPEYVITEQIISSGEFGKVLTANFHRSSGNPVGSFNDWLVTGSQSGGAVFDMHIHDVDTALWWFGQPESIETDGIILNDLPLTADSVWRYSDGKVATLHGSWDPNGGPFRMAFRVIMEKATVVFDSSTSTFQLIQKNEKGEDISRKLEAPEVHGYQNEINDYIACLSEGRKLERITPQTSKLTVVTTRQEMAQIEAKNGL